MALETLSYHKDIKITQAQTNVSYFYLNPLLQVEFRVIFEAFSFILLNGSKPNAIIVTYVNHKQRLGCLCSTYNIFAKSQNLSIVKYAKLRIVKLRSRWIP